MVDFSWGWSLDFLGRRAAFSPREQVLYATDREAWYSYGALEERASKLAAFLVGEAGLRRGDRVAVLARNCVEYFDFFFAAVKTGLVLVPLNARLSAAELAEALRQTGPRLLAYEQVFADSVAAMDRGTVERLLVLHQGGGKGELPAEDYDALLARVPAGYRGEPAATFEDPLLILFTGGTTGPPKGAVLSHRAVFFNMLSEAISWRLGPGMVMPNLLPLFHTGGWNIVTLPALFAGARVLISPSFDPELTLRLVERHRCTLLFAAATMYRMISSLSGFRKADLSSLQFVMSGAAPCPQAVMEPYWEKEVKFVQGYGITEGGPNNLFMPWYDLDWEQVREKNQSVGKPFLYCRARIAGEEGNEVARGELGELLLSGPAIFSGYWNKPEETAKTLRRGWVHTGDIARQDADGFFYIVDRKKDMFISGGENVFPVEVEKAIAAHPRVAEAAVIGIPDEKWGEVGKAFVVLKEGAALRPEELQDFLQSSLARYKIPKVVKFVEAIPKSSVGKVLKRVLQEQDS